MEGWEPVASVVVVAAAAAAAEAAEEEDLESERGAARERDTCFLCHCILLAGVKWYDALQ